MTEAPPAAARGARPGGKPPRDPARRIADVLQTLRTQRHLWLATAEGGHPHLVPLAYVWDGLQLLCVTKEGNRSVRNLRASGTANVAIGTPHDVVLIEATVTVSDPGAASAELAAAFDRLPLNPARVPGTILLHLRPERISAWRELSEMPGREVMRNGSWVTRPRV
jgi:hypothetical protein